MNKVRTMAMIDYVRERKYCSTDELMRAFDVSTATVRRDISEIVRAKHLRKVHGGVAIADAPVEATSPAGNDPFADRVRTNASAKERIARRAELLVTAGDIVFLDSSSTALFLARQLQKSRLPNVTIVTNSVAIVQEFRRFAPQFVLVSLGGSFNAQLDAFLGKSAIDALARLPLTKAFISAAGVTAHGLFTYHESHAEFLQGVRAAAREMHVLLDSSKFNKHALFEICALARVDSLISEVAPPEAIGAQLPRFHLADT